LDFLNLFFDAVTSRYPEYAVLALLVIVVGYLFLQIKDTRRVFSEENVASAARITELSNAVTNCTTTHATENKTLMDSLTAFQIEIARTTPTKNEMDSRIHDVMDGFRDTLGAIRDDLNLLKENLLRR
jgi:hypothetical protein